MGASGESAMRVVLFTVLGCLAIGCGDKGSDSGSAEAPEQNRDTASPGDTDPPTDTASDTGDGPPVDTATDSGLSDTGEGDTAGADAEPVDEDEDGYGVLDGDCDDTDPTVHPDAPEVCDELDNDCDGDVDEDPTDGIESYPDMDADGYGDDRFAVTACVVPSGYVTEPGDCNDTSATTSPGAAERCDLVDNDCDDEVDEGVLIAWYADTDGDGYGAADAMVESCDPGAGYVANDSDCDDTDPASHPGGLEVCDGIDNDCDDAADEDAIDAATWYTDGDGDGFGDRSSSVEACEAPDGTVADSSDCADADALVHPDALEVCDAIDNDCDGDIDDSDSSLDEATTPVWYADADTDGFGTPFYTRTRCEAPAGYVADNTDCNDLDDAVNPTATEVCDEDAVDEDCNGVADDADPDVDASTGTLFYVDIDGDGFGDVEDGGSLHCANPSSDDAWYSDEATDCNDDNAAISPDGSESCNGVDDDCDGSVDESGAAGESTWYADTDADGYGNADSPASACTAPEGHVEDSTDCDDTSELINPMASEVCDGIDNDCDGDVDDGDSSLDEATASTWYSDMDGDGYGRYPTTACEAPSGYIEDGTDCDDDNKNINPEAIETCNGVDDDCDDSIDESGAAGETTWYADADDDGYGDASSSTVSCSAPDGFTADSTDCDDTLTTVNPGADETCNGVDDNCDDTIDEPSAVDATTWYADADDDGYGSAFASTVSCSAPDGYIADTTDCNDAFSDINPGADEYCNDVDDDCDGGTDEASAIDASIWYADTDGDDYGDSSSSVVACEAPSEYVADGTDCDDSDPLVYERTGSNTFNYTGTMQTFTVPNCASEVTITAWGAQGRKSGSIGGSTGRGGMAQGTLSVTPGEALYVYVGGHDGYNGGGEARWGASNGGGASDVRQGTTELSDRVIVAGGGGGLSGDSHSGNGGHGGGGSCGANYCGGEGGGGYSGSGSNGGTSGGSGASGCHGGGGGGGGIESGGAGATSTCYGTYSGGTGTLGQGGDGNGYSCSGGGVAGGGGGYYGGGGAAGGNCGAGGGGGGSSWTGTLTDPVFSTGNTGDGYVTISW